MKALTPQQIRVRKIYALARERGIDNDTLHAHIYALTKKDSVKKLNLSEISKVIESLSGETGGRMTYKQKSYIFKLAKALGWVNEEKEVNVETLRGFVKNQVGVPTEEWLTKKQASIVIDGMKAIKKKDEERADDG